MPTSKQLAVIHVAKKQLGLSDDDYRFLLSSFLTPTGAPIQSSKQLNARQFNELMDYFRGRGFETKSGKKYRKITNEQMGKANAIRLDLGEEWDYVDSICKKMSKAELGRTIERFEWLPGDIQQKVLQSLIIHQNRQQKKNKETVNE